MVAILGGLGASVCWTLSALCATAASRRIGGSATLGWVMLVGLAVIGLPAALVADASHLSSSTIWLLVVVGVGNVLGLRFEYAAFRRGKVGVVTAIASTEGGVAALIAVFAGLSLSARTGVPLIVIAAGVVLAAANPDDDGGRSAQGRLSAGGLAVPTALCFGISLYAAGRVGAHTSVLWVLLAARAAGVMLIAGPVAARGQLPLPGRAWPLVLTAGVAEVLGVLSYTLGARDELAVAAVLSSQFAALSAVGAYFVFGERLARTQLAGLVIVVAGVSALAAAGT